MFAGVKMAKGSFRMKPIKIPFFLLSLSIIACTDPRSVESVSQPKNETHPVTHTSDSIQPKAESASNQAISEKISELETRRLELEVKRLAAEELRLAAAEQRLAAAQKRLESEQKRLASEERRLAKKEVELNSLNLQANSVASETASEEPLAVESKVEIKTPVLVETKTLAVSENPPVEDKKKLQSVVSTTKNPAFIKLENQYYLDLYKWELKTEVYRTVTYPDWAKSLGKTGNVSLDFTVDRNTRVSDVKGDNAGVSIQLVSELHRAIISAAKRVLPPDALPGDSWSMSISYNFQPHEVEQVALEKPVKPLFLEREHSTVLIDSDNNLEKYKEDVQSIIADQIEYPVWAEKLKQRGKVSFEIVINKDGSIAEVTPKEVNRHTFLNQEVLRAINDSAPLPSIPEHLRLQSTNMVIQHEFKR